MQLPVGFYVYAGLVVLIAIGILMEEGWK